MSSNTRCYLCGSEEHKRRNGEVRDNPRLHVLECKKCGLVFLNSFSHIKKGFYESSGMHGGKIDLNVWVKETERDDERRFSLLKKCIKGKSLLDFGCGNGGFLLRSRKVAEHVAGVEPEKSLIPYFKKEKLKVYSDTNETKDKFDFITFFHVLEHLPDPRNYLRCLSKRLKKNGQIIVEVPNSDDALFKIYECEAFSKFTYWSCHLFLFNPHTLKELIKQTGLKLNYIKQIQRYPLSNHLYWLSTGKPGGHKIWNSFDSAGLNSAYERTLSKLGCCDTIFASLGA